MGRLKHPLLRGGNEGEYQMRYVKLMALAMAVAPMGFVMADEPGPDVDGGQVLFDGRKEMDELPRLADTPKRGEDVIVPQYNPPRDRVILRGVANNGGWRAAYVEPAAAPEPYVVRDVPMEDAMATPAPVMRRTYRSTPLGAGFYAGVGGGSSKGEASFSDTTKCNKATYDEAKGFGVVQVGYMASHGNWRLGPELSLQLGGGMEADVECPVGSASCRSKVENLSTAAVRAGYVAGPVMPYALAGMAIGKTTTQVGTCTTTTSGGTCTPGPVDPCTGKSGKGSCTPLSVKHKSGNADGEDWTTGMTYGAGVEAFVTPKIGLRAEWARVDLGTSEVEISGKTVEVDNHVDTLKLTANYHF